MPEAADDGAPPRLLIVIAAVLAAGLAVAVAVFGLLSPGTRPVAPAPLPLVSVPAPQAGNPSCAALIGKLPQTLTSNGAPLPRRELAAPAPPAALAWGETDPVVVRCGLDRPPELAPTTSLRVVNGTQWLQVPGEGTSTWYAVDRDVYVAVTLPDTAGTGPLQEISETISTTLPARPLRF